MHTPKPYIPSQPLNPTEQDPLSLNTLASKPPSHKADKYETTGIIPVGESISKNGHRKLSVCIRQYKRGRRRGTHITIQTLFLRKDQIQAIDLAQRMCLSTDQIQDLSAWRFSPSHRFSINSKDDLKALILLLQKALSMFTHAYDELGPDDTTIVLDRLEAQASTHAKALSDNPLQGLMDRLRAKGQVE